MIVQNVQFFRVRQLSGIEYTSIKKSSLLYREYDNLGNIIFEQTFESESNKIDFAVNRDIGYTPSMLYSHPIYGTDVLLLDLNNPIFVNRDGNVSYAPHRIEFSLSLELFINEQTLSDLIRTGSLGVNRAKCLSDGIYILFTKSNFIKYGNINLTQYIDIDTTRAGSFAAVLLSYINQDAVLEYNGLQYLWTIGSSSSPVSIPLPNDASMKTVRIYFQDIMSLYSMNVSSMEVHQIYNLNLAVNLLILYSFSNRMRSIDPSSLMTFNVSNGERYFCFNDFDTSDISVLLTDILGASASTSNRRVYVLDYLNYDGLLHDPNINALAAQNLIVDFCSAYLKTSFNFDFSNDFDNR